MRWVIVNAWVMVAGAIRPATARDSQEDGPLCADLCAATLLEMVDEDG